MRKAVKIVSYSIILLALLFGITAIILTKLINPNDYKNYLNQYVYSHTKRHLIIKGDMKLSFIPWLGIDMKQVELTNPEGMKFNNLANIAEVKAKVRFWPLFLGKVEFGNIVIDQANINLITTANGKTNWGNSNKVDSLVQQVTGIENKPIANYSNNLPINQLNIAGVKIKDSKIKIINQQTKQKTQLTNVNINANSISLKKDFPIQASFNLQEDNSKTQVATQARASANINLQDQLYRLSQLFVKAKVERPEMPIILVKANGDMTADFLKQTLTLSPLKVQLANLDMKGNLKVTKLSETPEWTTTLSAKQVALEPLIKAIQGKSFIKGNLSFNTTLTSEGNTSKELLEHLNGKGKVNISNGALLGMNITSFVNQAEAIIQQKPLPTKFGPKQTSFSSLSGSYTIRNGVLNNSDLTLDGGQIEAVGSGTVNLNTDIINYVLTTQYHEQTNTQPQFELPISITGNILHPNIKPNYDSLARKALSKEIKSKLKQYSKNIGNFFKGL